MVLPAACYAEKEGTFTNTERRVQRIRAAVDAPGESREDWIILSEIMSRLGYENSFTSPREILEEIAQITPSYGGFSYDRLEKEQPQWPCPSPEHPGTPILHTAKFSRGERAIFKPSPYMPAAEQPDEHYPFILTTGRILYQYHTRTMTGRGRYQPHCRQIFVEIHPPAQKGIAQGDQVKVASRRGEVIVDVWGV